MKKILSAFLFLIFSTFAFAEPTGAPVKITSMRTYVGTGIVFIATDSNALCGTGTFTLDTKIAGGKEAYAAALAAYLSGKTITIEISNATGCTGWGTQIQSIYF
jgi:hypothetical protein